MFDAELFSSSLVSRCLSRGFICDWYIWYTKFAGVGIEVDVDVGVVVGVGVG